MGAMSRLRRLVVSDRWFFVTCRVLPRRRILSESEFACLARVIHERREEHGFLLSAWVFLPRVALTSVYDVCEAGGLRHWVDGQEGRTSRIVEPATEPRSAGGADIALYVCAPRPSNINYPHATPEAFLRRESSPLPDRQQL